MLIECNGEPIFENQKRLTDFILNDEKLRDKIIIYLHQKTDDKIMVSFKNEMNYEYISIENLKNYSMKRDASKTFNYVVNLIKFLANLCAGNNYNAINKLSEIYKRSTCIRIVSNSVLSSEIRTSFADLIHKLWFQCGEKAKSNKSRFFCKIWEEITEHRSDVKPPDAELLDLWVHIKSFLSDTVRLWKAKMFNKSDLGLLRNMLLLTADLIGDDALDEEEIKDLGKIILKMIFVDPESGLEDQSFQTANDEKLFSKCRILMIHIYQEISGFAFNNFIQGLFLYIKKETSKLDNAQVESPKKNLHLLLSRGLNRVNGGESTEEEERGEYPAEVVMFKEQLSKAENEFKNTLISKIRDFVTVTAKERELIILQMRKSPTADMELKLKTLDLLLDVFYKREEFLSFLKKMVLIKGDKELSLFIKYSKISQDLNSSRDKLKMSIHSEITDLEVLSNNSVLRQQGSRAS